MTTVAPSPRPQAARAAARLTTAAGWSIIAIAALHTAVFVPQAPWSEWFHGGLRTADPDYESVSLFWALPGSMVIPGLLLGALMIRIGRRDQRLGIGYPIVLFAWAASCVWLIGPSGFMTFLVPVGLLIAAAVADRKH